MQSDNSIEWDGIIKKEARGSNDEDLGEVQEIGDTYVLTQKGMLQKVKFYIPKYLVEGYDGSVLRFRVSEEEAKNSFVRDSPPSSNEYYKYKNTNTPRDIETRIPVIEERLNVSKSESTEEVYTETKTVDVPVTHEELSVERRPPSDRRYTSISAESPVDSQTEIKVPLKKEEVEVTKAPYVKEEVVVKKKPVTETHHVSEHLKSEEINEGSAVATEEKEE
jgi:uncharacterized protein (TIGR02271 family)